MRQILAGFVTLVIFQSCHTGRTVSDSGRMEDNELSNAISNFRKIGRLYKRDSVFIVTKTDLSPQQDIVVIGILRLGGKLLLTKNTKVGSKGILPSRYVEKDGKLYLWRDADFPLTEEALIIYGKYNILQDDENGSILSPSHKMDESQKGVHYYFCKKKPKKFKRVITNIGLGYYPAPRMKCND